MRTIRRRGQTLNDSKSVLAVLESAPSLLLPMVRELPEELRKRRPSPERWSVHEHACHLATVHPLYLDRLARMLAEERPELTPSEASPEERKGAFLHADLDEALERFERERRTLVARLRRLDAEQWERTGAHPEYDHYSVLTMARQLALHDGLHLYRIEELLQKRDWDAVAPTAAAAIPGAFARARLGKVRVLGPLAVPGLAPRRVRVYLPHSLVRGGTRVALYLFDGQNVFDDEPSFCGGWHAHRAVEALGRAGHPAPVVIGIDHGGEQRIHELSPFEFQGEPAKIDLLLDWLTGELMPELAAELGLAPGPAGAVVGGSSMGGLAALYAHFARPQAFGGALSMSPSYWIAERSIFEWIAEVPVPELSRVYLDCGVREGRGTLLPLVAGMAALLAGRGYQEGENLLWRPDPRGAHNEKSWRRRLPRALRFLYRKGEG